jgi:hypothetical protein
MPKLIKLVYLYMNAAAKLMIGLLVTIAGIAWYMFGSAFSPYIGMSAFNALKVIFVGSLGMLLIVIGLFVTWIEIEDIKDMKSEKDSEKEEKPEEKKTAKPARKKR